MKKIIPLIPICFPLLAVMLLSCEKVITIDLKNTDSRVVIQANVTSLPGPYTVKMNSSVSYYSNNTFPAISGAQVGISDNAGNAETLHETLPGVYVTDSLQGTPGRTYYLSVTANGKNYSAGSKMNNPLPLDSFVLEPLINRMSQAITGYRVTCKFTDPLGLGNYYRVVISSRDTAAIGDRTWRIVSDKYTDGTQMSVSFRTRLISGDSVGIELQSIDKSTYDFYNTLGNAVGSASAGQFLAALPANPTNNISNKGLGYFAAYGVTRAAKLVP